MEEEGERLRSVAEMDGTALNRVKQVELDAEEKERELSANVAAYSTSTAKADVSIGCN